VTTPSRSPRNKAWESLSPWDKAAQWHEKAPHIADELMALAKIQANHFMELDREAAEHARRIDFRLWIAQLIRIVGGLVCMAGLIVVAWHYADAGNVVPGLAIFGMGSGLVAGVYGIGKVIGRRGPQ
jgi:hypothetical protein